MVKNRYGWMVILLLLSLVAAACGGSDKKDSGATAVPGADEAAGPTSVFPPTWTPVPTLTEPPRVTIDYSYEQATEAPFPTRNPDTPSFSETPEPTAAPQLTAPTSFTITADDLNNLLYPQFITLTSYLQGAPVVKFQDGLVILEATVYTTPGDANSARAIVVEASAVVENGAIQLNVDKVTFADDNTPYADALPGYLMGVVRTAVNDLVRQLVMTQVPGGGSYVITDLNITADGIVVIAAPPGG